MREIDELMHRINFAKFKGREDWIEKLTVARKRASAGVDVVKAAHDNPREFTKSTANKVSVKIGVKSAAASSRRLV